MRNSVAAIVVATMIATGAFAATDPGSPLPSGKPAGVTRAQDGGNIVLYAVAGGFLITGLVLVLTNSNSVLTTGSTTTTTATTTTTK